MERIIELEKVLSSLQTDNLKLKREKGVVGVAGLVLGVAGLMFKGYNQIFSAKTTHDIRRGMDLHNKKHSKENYS